MAIPPFDPASEPLGSTSPRVREINSKLLDLGMHSKEDKFTDRFGEEKMTWEAMQNERIGLLIAGGQIFPTEAEGRAAAEDGWYFYVAGTGDSVSRILYQRVSATESRFISDDPSALFLSRVLAGASTGPKIWHYPYSEFHLTGFEHLTLDQNQNILTYQLGGETISLRNSEMRSARYPLTVYSDADGSDAAVDARGSVVSLMTVRDYFGRPCPYPFTGYSDSWPYVVVDGDDLIVEVKRASGAEDQLGELGELYIEVDADAKTVKAAWHHGPNKMIRVTYQSNGKNSLFNWRQTEIASGQALEYATWATIQSSNSDCWPPYVVEALNNGDGASAIYTGGNHGSDGGSGGLATAKMDSCQISVDGRRLLPGQIVKGFADSIRVEWVNQVMAYNTITFPRYVLEQRILMEITPGSASGFCEVEALEPIAITTDNGPQMFSGGYDTIHFYDGQTKSRMNLAETAGFSSGPFRTYPTWAAVLGSTVNGFHGAWMDREYGAGDGRFLGGSIGYWRRGGGSNTKVYAAVVGAGAVSFEAGNTYEWHGGYFWAPYEYAVDVDSAFVFRKRNKPTLGWATLVAKAGKIQIPQIERGSEITGLGVAGFSGVNFQTNGYHTSQNTVEL